MISLVKVGISSISLPTDGESGSLVSSGELIVVPWCLPANFNAVRSNCICVALILTPEATFGITKWDWP